MEHQPRVFHGLRLMNTVSLSPNNQANKLWVKVERDAIKCRQHEQHQAGPFFIYIYLKMSLISIPKLQEAVATATVEEEPHKEESGCTRRTSA